mgnify:CR=1 FL=1
MKHKRSLQNKRARFDYEALGFFEAGIVLTGLDIKAIRAGHVHLEGSFVRITGGEAWLTNATIGNDSRTRKLLLKKAEIIRLATKNASAADRLIPQKIFFSRGWAKVKVMLAHKKTKYDKRRVIQERELRREKERTVRT